MTEHSADQTPPGGQLDAEAARWCTLMHGADADAHRPEFEKWLRRGALHRQAYNRIEEVYVLGARLPPRLLADATAGRGAGPLSRAARLGAAAAAAAALIAVPAALWLAGEHGLGVALLGREVQLRLTTMTRSSEAFRLVDGSVVTLGADSDVTVAYGSRERRLTLARGRSRFDVAPERRPFVVEAGAGTVTALGTSFEVAMQPSRGVTVTVRSGAVEVRSEPGAQGGGAPTQRRLSAGDEFTYDAPASAASSSAPGSVSSEQPRSVGELVAQANERSHGGPTLHLADASLADVKVGGSFRAHEPAVVAQRLALMLDLDVERSKTRIVLKRR